MSPERKWEGVSMQAFLVPLQLLTETVVCGAGVVPAVEKSRKALRKG